MLTWYRVAAVWPECGLAPGGVETQSGGDCSGFFAVFCRRTAFPGCGGSIGGDVEQRAIHREFVCGMPTDIDVLAGADQQGTGPVWVAGAAHRGVDGPAGVSQGQGVVPGLRGLQGTVGGHPGERVVIGLDREVGGEYEGVGQQRACVGLLAAGRTVAGGAGNGDEPGRVAGRRS